MTTQNLIIDGYWDATCPHCHHRIGWRGQLTQRPACPECGHAVPANVLEREQAHIQAVLDNPCDGCPREKTCPTSGHKPEGCWADQQQLIDA